MKQIDITQELSQNFIDFSYEANSQRAFADARDGLKPGQRACLWEMYTSGYTSSKPHVKSAKIDGGVAARWWPHGTVAIYETFARMSQDWINNIPEVDWHGGNGSIVISGEPSADRYTEARLSKATEEGLLRGLTKENVNMIPNFSEDDIWPEVLPAIMPRLMVNGCQGIGMTIANTWLPHELTEISNVIIKYIQTGILDYSNLAPSFPSGGVIINKDDVPKIYETGKGKVIVRATAEIKDNSIFITELPYQVYVEPLIDQIKELIKNEEISGITDIDNKTSKNKLLIEIVCDNPSFTLSKLFQSTDLQKTYNANQWALVGKTPKLLTLKDYIDIYLQHNISCVKREYEYDIKKAKARLEIVNGLIKALEDIDNIIQTIKQSDYPKEALIKKYDFTDSQAQAIVAMKLGTLSRLEKIKLNKEQEQLTSNLVSWQNIVDSELELKNIIIDRLSNFTKKYGKSRRTALTQIDVPKIAKEKPVVEPKDCVVIITKSNMIKRVDKKNFKPQKRNTAGVKTNGDIITYSVSINTQDVLLIFSTKGKMYRVVVDAIPEGTNTSAGVPISSLVKFEDNDYPVIYTTMNKDTGNYIFLATKFGIVKKVPFSEYEKTKKSGILAITLKDGDEIADAALLSAEDIGLVTRNGMFIRFSTDGMPISSRIAQGVKGITLNDGDSLLKALPISPAASYLAIVSKDGQGKKVSLNEFTTQGRGGKGVICSKLPIAGAAMLGEEDNLLISGDKTSIVVSGTEIPALGRTAQGVSMIKNNMEVISISKI